MQRLYSVFPNSWPGLGLLILRAAAGFTALRLFNSHFNMTAETMLVLHALTIGSVILLWAGLCTPVAAIVEAMLQIGTMALGKEPVMESAIYAALGVGLALLGPGSWSLDAWLFGYKRIL
jgi:putative oxidoreductase